MELRSSVAAQGIVGEVTERAGAGEQVGLCFLSGLHGDLGVARETRAGRDELTDDDVFLEAEQRIALAFHGRLRQDAGGFLEGSCGQPGLGRQGRLGDAHELGTAGSRRLALGHNTAVGIFEAAALGELAGQQVRFAGLDDRDAAQHLADDNLDVLVVDTDALAAVHALDLVNQELLRGTGAHDAQNLLGVDRTVDELLADADVLAVFDEKT